MPFCRALEQARGGLLRLGGVGGRRTPAWRRGRAPGRRSPGPPSRRGRCASRRPGAPGCSAGAATTRRRPAPRAAPCRRRRRPGAGRRPAGRRSPRGPRAPGARRPRARPRRAASARRRDVLADGDGRGRRPAAGGRACQPHAAMTSSMQRHAVADGDPPQLRQAEPRAGAHAAEQEGHAQLAAQRRLRLDALDRGPPPEHHAGREVLDLPLAVDRRVGDHRHGLLEVVADRARGPG